MKISAVPTSSKIPERKECTLVQSSPDHDLPLSQMSVSTFNQDNKFNKAEQNTHEESKVLLSTNMKTDGREGEVSRFCRSKRVSVSCQDTIHESEEDDGLTMEKVGK